MFYLPGILSQITIVTNLIFKEISINLFEFVLVFIDKGIIVCRRFTSDINIGFDCKRIPVNSN